MGEHNKATSPTRDNGVSLLVSNPSSMQQEGTAVTFDSSPVFSRHKAKWSETILFFTSAVGCTLGWTSVLSNLVYYTNTLGVNSYLYLNVCIYAPLFPITVAQTLWDADFDRQFTSLKSFWWRGTVGFAVMLIGTVLMAKVSELHSLTYVSILSLFLGIASGILHGTLKQMASFVYPGCGRLAAAVTAGLQASAVFVLLVSVISSRVTHKNDEYWLYTCYGSISVLVLLCWIAFQRLMTHSEDVYRSMIRRDASVILMGRLSQRENSAADIISEGVDVTSSGNDIAYQRAEELEEPLLSDNTISEQTESFDDERTDQLNTGTLDVNMPSMLELFYRMWPLCVAMFVTVASSMAVASWFNRVPSTTHPNLPQVLFYTRLFADLFARPATLLLPTYNTNEDNSMSATSNRRNMMGLIGLVSVRLLFVPYFFLYTTNVYQIPHNDILMTLGVFGFAFSSGFITTWVYQLAPVSCLDIFDSTVDNDSFLLQQTNLLNVCFSGSVLVGVVGSAILTR